MKRTDALSQIEKIVAPVALAAGLEVVEIELKGSGRHQMLRIVIDKPGGVTHADCELITREAGEELDAVDPIAGPYQLEVSSPGVERPLKKWQDWERFVGQKVKVILKEPLELPVSATASGEAAASAPPAKPAERKYFDGVVRQAENQRVTVELADGEQVAFSFDQVSRAHLKFEW